MRSLLVSSVKSGRITLIVSPDVIGCKPKSDCWIAFSIRGTLSFSHGIIASVFASSTIYLKLALKGLNFRNNLSQLNLKEMYLPPSPNSF